MAHCIQCDCRIVDDYHDCVGSSVDVSRFDENEPTETKLRRELDQAETQMNRNAHQLHTLVPELRSLERLVNSYTSGLNQWRHLHDERLAALKEYQAAHGTTPPSAMAVARQRAVDLKAWRARNPNAGRPATTTDDGRGNRI